MDGYESLRIAIVLQAHEDYLKWGVKGETAKLEALKREMTSSFFSAYISGVQPELIFTAWNTEIANVKANKTTISQVITQHGRRKANG